MLPTKITRKNLLTIEGTNREQYNCLMTFMVDNPLIAGQGMIVDPVNNTKYDRFWADLTLKLNLCGPPMRAVEDWKKVWEDHKANILKPGYIVEILNRHLMTDQREDSDNESVQQSYSSTSPIINLLDDEKPPLQVEQPNMVSKITNATDELILICDDSNSPPPTPVMDIVTQPTSSFNVDLSGTNFQDQDSIFKKLDELEKELGNIKRAKIAISRQKVNLKEERLYLRGMLHNLKEEKFNLKCEQLKYRPQQREAREKKLQMQQAAKLKNSINSKFKKIFYIDLFY